MYGDIRLHVVRSSISFPEFLPSLPDLLSFRFYSLRPPSYIYNIPFFALSAHLISISFQLDFPQEFPQLL